MGFGRISRIIMVQNLLKVLRYGFPGATNPLYSNLEVRRTNNHDYAIKPVELITSVGYTKNAIEESTREEHKGRLIDLIA